MAGPSMRGVAATTALLLGALAPAAAASSVDLPRVFTIVAGGDVLIHRSLAAAADAHLPGPGYDFRPLLTEVEPWVSEADFAICHLEGALSPDGTRLSYYPLFNVPHEVAGGLAAAGWDACSTAGNHTVDGGASGIGATLAALDAAGIGHTGSAAAAGDQFPVLYDVEGVIVAHISYTYDTNGIPPPEPWSVNITDIDAILEDAAGARARGAEFVIVSMHWGAEYQPRPTPLQQSQAEAILSSPDVDLILGCHVHVVQPIDWINQKPVVYGMGNHISNIRSTTGPGRTGAEDGVLVHLTVTEQPGGGFLVTDLSITPTWVQPVSKAVLPIEHVLGVEGEPGYAAAMQASLDRTVARIGLLGATAPTTRSPWPAISCRGRAATIAGTDGDDVLEGTDGDDVIVGRGGDDLIDGAAGADLICGDTGDDVIIGGSGDDALIGGGGGDRIEGGSGRDLLYGHAGDDILFGGTDGDRLTGGGGVDVLYGGPGDDVIVAGVGDGAVGGPGSDTCPARTALVWGCESNG